MLRFAANLSMLYREVDFLARFAAAAGDGFKGVEFLFPYEHAPRTIAELLREHRLEQVLFNAPPGNWDAGERGLACIAGREAEFGAGIERALDYARQLGCPRIHVMAGIAAAGAANAHATYVANLRHAAALAAAHGVTLMIEPINGRDMPGYFLQFQDQAHALRAEIGAANVQVQMDLYHCQVGEGDLASKLRRYLPGGQVGHLQIAGVPGRHEPDVGEIHYPYLFALLEELGYAGWIGCEYLPLRGTRDGLGWLRERAGGGFTASYGCP